MFKLAQIFSTIFFIGNSKFIPGTIGSIISIILIFFLNKVVSYFIFISIFVIILFLSLIFIEIYSRSINKYDSKEIIIDEFLGIYLIMIFFPFYSSLKEIINILLIFLIFRFFDIIKIFPANWIDKNIKNSFGVICDDLIASIYTIIIILLINFYV